MPEFGRQTVYAAFIVRVYGQYNVKFYNLYFTDSGILLSYMGESYRSFFLRWDVTLIRIRETVDVDAVLAAKPGNLLIPYGEIQNLVCKSPNAFVFGKIQIEKTDGTTVRYVLGKENYQKNPMFGHLLDDMSSVERLPFATDRVPLISQEAVVPEEDSESEVSQVC